jgi:two-component system sensor histidine kinase ChiS
LGKVRVKCKQAPVHVFEIIDPESDEIRKKKIALKSKFSQAIDTYYQKQFKPALKQFQALLIEFPEDTVAHFYSERCEYYLEQGIPDDWDGIEVLTQK